MIECERHVLPNGLKVIITPITHSSTITSMILVLGGSRFEKKEKAGISHFMEHMFFQGGVKYPTSFAADKLIDSIGGECEALTEKEVVIYYVKHGSSCGNLGLDILEDMLMHARFPEKELEKERKVVLEELGKGEDDVATLLFESIDKHLLYGNHPLGVPILGTRNTIKNFKKSDLFEYRNTFYKPNNMVISVAGNVNPEDILRDVQSRFGSMIPGPVPEMILFEESQIKKNRVFVQPLKQTKRAVITLVAPGMVHKHPDYFPMQVLISILGDGMSSRLHQELRENRGLVYGIQSFGEVFREIGTIYSHWETSAENTEKTLGLVMNEYQKLREDRVENEELQRFKDKLTKSREMKREKSEYFAGEFGQDELMFGRIICFDEYCRIINAVTKDDILRLARTYLGPEKLKVAIAAEKKYCKKEKIQKILENAR